MDTDFVAWLSKEAKWSDNATYLHALWKIAVARHFGPVCDAVAANPASPESVAAAIVAQGRKSRIAILAAATTHETVLAGLARTGSPAAQAALAARSELSDETATIVARKAIEAGAAARVDAVADHHAGRLPAPVARQVLTDSLVRYRTHSTARRHALTSQMVRGQHTDLLVDLPDERVVAAVIEDRPGVLASMGSVAFGRLAERLIDRTAVNTVVASLHCPPPVARDVLDNGHVDVVNEEAIDMALSRQVHSIADVVAAISHPGAGFGTWDVASGIVADAVRDSAAGAWPAVVDRICTEGIGGPFLGRIAAALPPGHPHANLFTPVLRDWSLMTTTICSHVHPARVDEIAVIAADVCPEAELWRLVAHGAVPMHVAVRHFPGRALAGVRRDVHSRHVDWSPFEAAVVAAVDEDVDVAAVLLENGFSSPIVDLVHAIPT